MRIKRTITAGLFVVSAISAPAVVQALDLTFLDQAPIRFFNDADLQMMGEAADQALDEAADGEAVSWSNEQSGSSGTLTPVRSFTRDGRDCRRIKVVSMARQATRGRATSNVDFCKVDGTWKILTIAR